MQLLENTVMTFVLGVKVTQDVAQSHLHHVTYAHAMFKVAISNGLVGDAFTENASFDLQP